MDERFFMGRAIELAAAVPFTSPNPRVGAVLVRDGAVIGEGAHRGAGTPHAETVAMDGVDAAGATLYVTLEPCSHHGRTPPCAPAIAAAGVQRVVAAMEDPDPRVSGAGFEMLRERGVEVVVGPGGAEARELNAAWIHRVQRGRPYVSMKLALSIDGRLSAGDGSSRWITGASARRRVHERRRQVDAILVGSGTVLADDPSLTVRDVEPTRQPTRVLLDSRGRVSPDASIFTGPGEVVVATTAACDHERQTGWKAAGAEVLIVPGTDEGVDVAAVIDHLGRAGAVEVLCEGGPTLATSMLRAGLVDRLEVHTGPRTIGLPGASLGDLGVRSIGAAPAWRRVATMVADEDVITTYERTG